MAYVGASLVVQMVKNMPAMQETQVCSLGLEDSLDIHSSIVVCRIPWTEEPGGLHFMGLQRIGLDWETHTYHGIYWRYIRVKRASEKNISSWDK